MTMAKADPEREERRREQKEIADSLKASGALDEIFARIDAGEPLTGHAGLLKGVLKASLERGMEAELTDHVGYERGDPDTAMFSNSRNGGVPERWRPRSVMSNSLSPVTGGARSRRCSSRRALAASTGSTHDHLALRGRDDRA